MKRIIGLLLLAVMCGGSATIDAQNYNSILKSRNPKTDVNGYYNLLDCPQSLPNVKVTEADDDGTMTVIINGNEVNKLTCVTSSYDVRFVDANFDGYYDLLIGPAIAREYSYLYLWDSKKQSFCPAIELNGDYIINPAKKQWASATPLSYCLTDFDIFRFEGNEIVYIESLNENSNPERGLWRYTISQGDLTKLETNKKSRLPKRWRIILKEFYDSYKRK